MVTASIPVRAPCHCCEEPRGEEVIVVQSGPVSLGQLIRAQLRLYPDRHWEVGETIGQ